MNTPPPSKLSSKSQPIPWTHQETVNLIQAYQEKWYALERGQLKSNQWEEVAATVAARCGYGRFQLTKTLIQCRHKMEKLRQRFRSEKNRLAIGTLASSRWLYFDLMNNLLQGPLPISARPMALVPFRNHEFDPTAEKSDHYSSDSDSEDRSRSKSKSISNILRRPVAFDGSSSRRGNRDSSDEDEDDDDEEEEERNVRASRFVEEDLGGDAGRAGEGKEMCSKLAAEIRVFADRLVGMESLKMEMVKEAEMNRIAMENRRIEMILESEEKILNSIEKAFGSHPPKKMKIGHDS